MSFGKRWDTGRKGISIGNNSAGHCSRLIRYLIPMNFLKQFMIGKLKMGITGRIFGKICE